MEVGEVIGTEFQVGSHSLVIQVLEVGHVSRVVPLDGGVERRGELSDRVVGGGLRKVDGGRGRRGGLTSIAVVNGVVQVADVVVGRAAD